jgi:plasmid stabilization system protein ParE
MAKKIIWTIESEQDFSDILEYLSQNWNNSVALTFIDLVDLLLTQISINPNQYPVINRKLRIRKCVITKHNSLYYRNRRNHIELLRIYDNRQNPDNLKFY